jgi:hypothetical protein
MSSDKLEQPDGKPSGLVATIYALREAAVDHGLALASVTAERSSGARDRLLTTQIELEERTVAAIDECAQTAPSSESGAHCP